MTEAVKALKPTALIGVSGKPKQFNRAIVEEMARNNAYVLFPALAKIRQVSVKIATQVVKVAQERGLTTRPIPQDVTAYVESLQYQPVYKNFA